MLVQLTTDNHHMKICVKQTKQSKKFTNLFDQTYLKKLVNKFINLFSVKILPSIGSKIGILPKYPDRRIYQSTVSRIENKFREFGNVTDIPKSGSKQKLDILLDIQDNPHKPTRQVAADNDVKLNDDDPDRQLEFCEIMANRCQDNPLFIKKHSFSDEATFVLGYIISTLDDGGQYPEKVNVWAGIINSRIIGPYFFDGTLTSARYWDFLKNFLVPELRMLFPDDDNPNEIDRNIWFQRTEHFFHWKVSGTKYPKHLKFVSEH
ncbi:hypothetical protein NQ318_014935 [Aromia moschata]|uniref:Uncharacterized protein n=1 Tax=Aromia moschata TaxID=1265417 RepID=A0AAV8XJZ6_9CUCU|nr:hypothetical protein NQ318_014935 [Aromia moschata]